MCPRLRTSTFVFMMTLATMHAKEDRKPADGFGAFPHNFAAAASAESAAPWINSSDN